MKKPIQIQKKGSKNVMEKELASKVFLLQEYASKENMEEHIKEYIRNLKEEYPLAIVTREFFKGKNILVRATQILQIQKNKKELEMENELEKEEVRIKEKGINGIGENTQRNLRERGGHERERGAR